jgi:hypothetical protein
MQRTAVRFVPLLHIEPALHVSTWSRWTPFQSTPPCPSTTVFRSSKHGFPSKQREGLGQESIHDYYTAVYDEVERTEVSKRDDKLKAAPCSPLSLRHHHSTLRPSVRAGLSMAEAEGGPGDDPRAIVDRLVAAAANEDILFVLLELTYLHAHPAGLTVDTCRTYLPS